MLEKIRCNAVVYEPDDAISFKEMKVGEFVYSISTGHVGQKISGTLLRYYYPDQQYGDARIESQDRLGWRRCSSVKIEVTK